jgi:hypothetical protein
LGHGGDSRHNVRGVRVRGNTERVRGVGAWHHEDVWAVGVGVIGAYGEKGKCGTTGCTRARGERGTMRVRGLCAWWPQEARR